jgi:hypothetical protein
MDSLEIKLLLTFMGFLLSVVPCHARIWDVKEFGARGDKQTNDGPAIQAVIDKCAAAGGGTVFVPAGDYPSGQLRLRSNVTLHIDVGATLWVSPKKEDYKDGNRFLFAEGESNITLAGRGTIHGTGEADLMRKRTDKPEQRPEFRAGILEFVRCKKVTIEDVTVQYSDSWTFDLELCENVVIDCVSILNNYYRVNADGIDPVSCRSVRISNCHIVAGDDCIVFKTREGMPCEDVVVTNCILESVATAIKIGTESPCDFRNILVSNCVIRNSTVGIGMYIKDGGTAEQISFSNCTIETIRRPELAKESLKNSIYPIFVDIEKRLKESRIGHVRDLTFSDITIVSDNGVLIQGMGTSKIENVTLHNVTMRVDRGVDYAKREKHVGGKSEETEDRRQTIYARKPSYVTLANVEGLTVDGLRVFIPDEVFGKYPRSALSLHNVGTAIIGDVRRQPHGAGSEAPVMMMENCRNALLTKCLTLPEVGVFLCVTGAQTSNVCLSGNDLSKEKRAVHVSDEVPKGAVRD